MSLSVGVALKVPGAMTVEATYIGVICTIALDKRDFDKYGDNLNLKSYLIQH